MKFSECITGLLLGNTYVRSYKDDPVYMRMINSQIHFKSKVSDYQWNTFSLDTEDLTASWEPAPAWKDAHWHQAWDWARANPNRKIQFVTQDAWQVKTQYDWNTSMSSWTGADLEKCIENFNWQVPFDAEVEG